MQLKYIQSRSTIEPKQLEITEYCVFLRKDITRESVLDDYGQETIFYSYMEAKLSVDEFNRYSEFLAKENAIKGKNVPDNIINILFNQENNDSNQLTIMEAIADLYVMISELKGGTN